MDNKRRTFLKNAALASSALAVSKTVSAQDADSTGFLRIATEETFSIPEVIDAMTDLVSREPDREPGLAPPSYVGPDTTRALLDLGPGRIAAMDAARIDKEVLSMWSPGVQVLDAEPATELARLANDRLAEAIRRYPDRLAGLTAVAPQNPDAAAQEIERGVSSLGLNGVIINSHTNGEHLDDPKFWPIFESAQALDTPIYLHPRTPPATMYQAYADFSMGGALWGYAMETSMHVVRLILSGVFDEFPRLRIVLGHMGEGLPFWLNRIDTVASRPGMLNMQRAPSEYFRDNFVITTSAMFWDPLLTFCISVLGADKVLFGIDSPFAPSAAATDWMDAAPISASDRKAIYQDNAERVFSL
jgi:5-carboxyvanillate decarboxylase